MANEARYTFLGMCDDRTTCEQCGKPNLKRVVALGTADGETVFFGTDCAGRALLGSKSASNTKIVAHSAMAEAYARKVLASHGAKVAAQATWNRFGYSINQTKDGGLRMRTGAGMVEIKPAAAPADTLIGG